MKRLMMCAPAALALALMLAVTQAEEPKEKKFEAKCPVSGKAASKDHAVAYKKAEVYFCCPNCPKAFEKETAKYSKKANMQLVKTKQAKNVKCPLTGRPLNKEAVAKVGTVKVAFCCNNCKGKVEKADEEEKLVLVFSDEAFEKGFEIKKPKKED